MSKASSVIVKNTLFLYCRMLCIMLVALYTSRVILAALGVEDYGIYQTVGGIVALLSVLNGALSTGSSRFLTFEMGRGDKERLGNTFSTLLLVHIIMAALVVVVGEPIGYWYIYSHLHIPAAQLDAAFIVYQFSLVTAVMSMTQVPYTAVIIAHENMRVYAYVSLIEAMLRLGVAYFIGIYGGDRLVCYALLLCIVQVSIIGFYRIYCRHFYRESQLVLRRFRKEIFQQVGAFSAWSVLAAVSTSCLQNVTLILLTNFFSPALAASRAIAVQVNNAANQLISNFRTAANPQIVKRFAAQDYEGSQRLLLKSMAFSYYLMFIVALPVILLAEPFLQLWLGQVPDYAVPFLQWSMAQSLVSVFDTSLYTALYAKGQLRENALLSPTVGFVGIILLYLLFRSGSSPMAVCYILTGVYTIVGLIIKPLLVRYIVNYRLRDVLAVFWRCLLVTVVSTPLPAFLSWQINTFAATGFIIICAASVASVAVAAWCVGMNAEERSLVRQMIGSRLHRG